MTTQRRSSRRAGTSMKHITCIEDLRQLHKRRVPKAFFDYADRGSYSEDTLRANRTDLQVIGQRHADIKNGMTVPPEWSLSKLFDFATKPTWVSGVLRGKRRTFGNLAGHLKISDDITSLSTWINSQFDTTLNWKDIDW